MLHGGEGGREFQQSDVSRVGSTGHHLTSTVTPHCMQRVITHLIGEGGREVGGGEVGKDRGRDGDGYTHKSKSKVFHCRLTVTQSGIAGMPVH